MKKHFGIALFIGTALVLFAWLAVHTFSTAPAPTSLPVEITDAKDVTMRLVPAGEFILGSDTDDSNRLSEQRLYLDAFYMDKYEVTNAHYADCVTAGICQPPHETASYFRSSYYGDARYEHFPVIYVDWHMAQTYCGTWRAARLLLSRRVVLRRGACLARLENNLASLPAGWFPFADTPGFYYNRGPGGGFYVFKP